MCASEKIFVKFEGSNQGAGQNGSELMCFYRLSEYAETKITEIVHHVNYEYTLPSKRDRYVGISFSFVVETLRVSRTSRAVSSTVAFYRQITSPLHSQL